MTEAEWLATTDPVAVLAPFRDRFSYRKLMLAVLHACRELWDDYPVPLLRTGLAICERQVDGRATSAEMARFLGVLVTRLESLAVASGDPAQQAKRAALLNIITTIDTTSDLSCGRTAHTFNNAESVLSGVVDGQAQIVRDIFGNPFRPVAVDPRWRTADVLGLARGIYEDRAFDRLPLLADALMDAGCDEEQLLAHCRSEGPHVRGCWAVDLVLDKE